ncbi:hypothetical protein D4764_0113560, partial [Takifugu flavidus]
WYLIEYMDGFQEFVKSGSIRNKNTDTFCTVEMLMQIFWLEEPRVRLQRAKAHAAGNGSLRDQKCLSSEAHSGQPPDSGEHTEELWQTDEDQPVWTLKCNGAQASKGQKPARRHRRRNWQRRLREYTMDDEYDDEEIRMTPQGLCLFRLFGSRWVAMA